MSEHPVKQLHDYFFDRTEPDERGRIAAHLTECHQCTSRLAELQNAVEKVPPVKPTVDLLQRIFSSVGHVERFSGFAPRLGELLAVSRNDARRALHAFADVNSWPLHPLPGMRAFPLASPSVAAGGRAILACFEPTSMVPPHRHWGDETILVFQGAFESSEGRIIAIGDELRSKPGSLHSIPRILGDVQCLCAIINTDRIEYEDSVAGGGLS